MAGRDASANLGGMLSQIGSTIGSMGQAGQGLMRPITMSFRPTVDMTDPESLRRQAAFFGRVGDTEQQRMFSTQAETVAAKEQAETQRAGQAAIAGIKREITGVLQSKVLTPEQKSAKLAELQTKADAAATTYKLNPLQTADLAATTQREYVSGVVANNAVLDRQTAIDTEATQREGRAKIASLNASIQETLRNPALSDEDRQNKLAALQSDVTETATTYKLNPTQYMGLVDVSRSGYLAEQNNELSLQSARNTNERTLALRALEGAFENKDQDLDAYNAARANIQQKHPGLLKQFDRAEERYAADKAAWERAAANTGDFTDDEIKYYTEQLNVPEAVVTANNKIGLHKSFRNQMTALSINLAAERRKAARGSAIEYGVIQDVIPSVVKEIREREGSGKDEGWFWADKGAAEVINNLLEEDGGAGLKELSARVKASGATTIEDVKRVVLQEIERLEPGSVGSLLAKNPDYNILINPPAPAAPASADKKDDKDDGTTTVTLPNGQTATIKQKSS